MDNTDLDMSYLKATKEKEYETNGTTITNNTHAIPFRSPQVPKPEPRTKSSSKIDIKSSELTTSISINQPAKATQKQMNEPRISKFRGDLQSRELVKKSEYVAKINHLNRRQCGNNTFANQTVINSTPIVVDDDSVASTATNMEYDYDYEPDPDSYYDEEDDYEPPGPTGLTDLSRQSMMPLHELIAYYQYIQQDHKNAINSKSHVSRQSSCASNSRQVDSFESYTDRLEDRESTSGVDKLDGQLQTTDIEYIESELAPKLSLSPHRQLSVVKEGQIEACENINPNQADADTNGAPSNDTRNIRANVVLELINSERDFVKHLNDVVEGYLFPARRHPEIFTFERINTIFSNIEQLFEFQKKFLNRLESCIDWNDLANSCVGNCFLEYESGFSVYHYYCNNHPNAISELQDLYTKPRFVKFFEACRLLQNMIDISLDGFLLTPIQKICKYPLQLNELLKNTPESHDDFKVVVSALESMRNCANLANERKRRIEALADVMSFQEKVDSWFGPKLNETSSILIHSGEVSKVNSHTWYQTVQLFLFDHLLVYAKKDMLKRNSLILKGRICTDSVTEIADADEYKPKKSFKLYCSEQQKWFVFITRSEKEKDEWIRAFERQQNIIESDEIEGFQITDREIGVARRALQNRKHSRSARYRHKRPDTAVVDQLDLEDANIIMNRTLSLPSCIHPSHVMNFVEDSKVVSHKKSGSPNQSCRSPTNPATFQTTSTTDNTVNQQPSSVNWFKKMGSKKLTRSQVYTVNGESTSGMKTQNSSSSLRVDHSDTGITCFTPTSPISTAASNYDQLEKRHRDHMMNEEQARLFRLNNDLPIPSVLNPNLSPPIRSTSSGRLGQQVTTSSNSGAGRRSSLQKSLIFDSNIPIPSRVDVNRNTNTQFIVGDGTQAQQSSFETTIVLSSGKVVTVREDSV